MFKHILCPIDGSQGSLQALDVAGKLAAEQQASLTICMVVDPAQAAAMAFGEPAMSAACYHALDDEAEQIVHDAAARVRGVIAAATAVINGQTVPGILDYAAGHMCDLIVMGSHGRTGISRALVGSVAEGIVRHASVPVMIIRWLKETLKERRPQAAAAVAATTAT